MTITQEENLKITNEIIAKVHDHIEGRYDLDSLDLMIVHSLLASYQNTLVEAIQRQNLPINGLPLDNINGI